MIEEVLFEIFDKKSKYNNFKKNHLTFLLNLCCSRESSKVRKTFGTMANIM